MLVVKMKLENILIKGKQFIKKKHDVVIIVEKSNQLRRKGILTENNASYFEVVHYRGKLDTNDIFASGK